jgi:putative ABC transport system permease protein
MDHSAYYAAEYWLTGFAYRIEVGLGVFVAGGAVALAVAWLAVGHQTVKAACRRQGAAERL